MNFNRVVLVGRITKDPELRRTQSQQVSYVMFTLAVNKRFQQQESADFISCVAWDKKAEFISNYIKKGALLLVEGRLQTRKYEAQDGNRMIVEVVCEDVQPLEKLEQQRTSKQNIQSLESTYTQSHPTQSNYNNDFQDYDENDAIDDNVPF